MQNLSPQRDGILSIDDALPVENHAVGEARKAGKKALRKPKGQKEPAAKKQKGKRPGRGVVEGPVEDGANGSTALVSPDSGGQLPLDEPPLPSPSPKPVETPWDREPEKATEAPGGDDCHDPITVVAPPTSAKRRRAETAAQDGDEDPPPPPPAADAKRKGNRKKASDKPQGGEAAAAAPEESEKPAVDPVPKEPEVVQSKKRGPHSPIRGGKVPHRVGLSKRARIEPLLSIRRK